MASEGLQHSLFRRSVVLLTAHNRCAANSCPAIPPSLPHLVAPPKLASPGAAAPAPALRNGARGLMLTQPIHAQPPTLRADQDGNHTAGSRGPVLRHFLGGPVGMPGEGINQELAVLHPFSFGRRLVPAAAGASVDTEAVGRGNTAAAAAAPLHECGSLADVMAAAAQQENRSQPGREGLPILVFHGVCAWAEGQLEGTRWALHGACSGACCTATPVRACIIMMSL